MNKPLSPLLDDYLAAGEVGPLLSQTYPNTRGETVHSRFLRVAEGLIENYPDVDLSRLRFVSTPGRTELGGNHTDHNLGRVVAASIELDALAAVVPTEDSFARLRSRGFSEIFEVDVRQIGKVRGESGTQALLRGVIDRFRQLGYGVGGFAAYLESEVLPGSGMSSSAAVEVLLATILSSLFNEGRVPPVELAKVGRYAENEFMGKPCGLMDQIACASGGIVAIDFADPETPEVRRIEADFRSAGYLLAIVDTGGSHANLTDAYAAIPAEMGRVAELLGRRHLRGVELDELLRRAREIREGPGDRALLRAIHFVMENGRADRQRQALEAGDVEAFVALARESGSSSWRFLQNCLAPGSESEQSLAAGLAVAEALLAGRGAARVHGGGFAGTMQVFLPVGEQERFVREMEELFGGGCVTLTGVRQTGTVGFPELAL